MLSLFISVPLTLIAIIGPVLNGCVVIAILSSRQISSVNQILLLHLGALNLILGILYLVFFVPSFTVHDWISLGLYCSLFGFFFTLFHSLIIWTICGLNCDRYYAIASPLHYGFIVSKKKVLLGLIVGWIISLALCIPPLMKIAPYGYIQGPASCAPNYKYGKGLLMYSAMYTIFTMLIPATLIICCNLKILMIARYHRHRIASAIYEVTLSAQVAITHQRNPFFLSTGPTTGESPKLKGKSAIFSVFQLLGSFLVLYFPYYTLVIWQALGETLMKNTDDAEVHQYIYTIALILLMSSVPINGFLYGVKNKVLQTKFQNYLRKKHNKSELNQEIQARTPSTCGSRRPSLTPFGFFTRPTLQRRLSEAFIDVRKNITSPKKSKIKRIASDIAWKPYSNSNFNILSKNEVHKNLKQSISCNTLQLPPDADLVQPETEDKKCFGLSKPNSPSESSTTHLFIHKFFSEQPEKKVSNVILQNIIDNAPKKSPRILITRAFSEESDQSSVNVSSKVFISKIHSSSSTSVLERKRRKMRYKFDESESRESSSNQTITPLLANSYTVARDSDSSEASDTSSGKIFMSLDNKTILVDEESNERHLLLSRTSKIKFGREDITRKKLLKTTLKNIQTKDIVL